VKKSVEWSSSTIITNNLLNSNYNGLNLTGNPFKSQERIDFILMNLLTKFYRKWSKVPLPLYILVKILHITHISTKGSSMIKLLRLPLTVLTFFGLISAVSADLDSGLVRYMKFEEGSGDSTYDSSGYGDHGTCSVRYDSSFNPWTTTGYSGGGMHFKGGGDYPDGAGVSGEMPNVKYITISVWVKPDSGLGDDGYIVSGPGRLVLFDSCGLSFPCYVYGNSHFIWGNRKVKSNEWNHITVAVGQDTSWMYINGILDTIKENTDSVTSDTGRIPILIGGMLNSPPCHFKGSIDEVRVYNRALSGSEINNIYDLEKNLVGRWPFEEGSGDTVHDVSNNNMNGMRISATWVADTIQGDSCLDFDGINDSVEINNISPLANLTQGSMTCWAKLRTDNNLQNFTTVIRDPSAATFLCIGLDMRVSNNLINVRLDRDGGVQWQFYGYYNELTPFIGKWIHLTFVHDGDSAYYYINGTKYTPRAWSGTTTNKSVWLKGIITDASHKCNKMLLGCVFDGEIDDVRIYKKVLSDSDVISIMNDRH
jgi:hypothetical protein